MRYNEILSEKSYRQLDDPKSKNPDDGRYYSPHSKQEDIRFLRVWELVERQCSDIISHYKATDRVFYRGTEKSNTSSMYLGKPPKDRRPTGSSRVGHDFTDIALKMFGYPTLRSNHIAVTSSFHQASSYGTVYVIFPKNGFKFLWSDVADDWISLVSSSFYEFLDYCEEQLGPEKTAEISLKLMDIHNLNPDDYDRNLRAVWFGAVNHDFQAFYTELEPYVREFWMKRFKEYRVDDSDINAALKSHHEVMISGTGYYAFNWSAYGDYLIQLGIPARKGWY